LHFMQKSGWHHVLTSSRQAAWCMRFCKTFVKEDDVKIGNSYSKPVLAKVSLQLHTFQDWPKFDGNFNYCLAAAKLNYLDQTAMPYIRYAVHQVAKILLTLG
jgi:hypothetical protein